MICDSPRIPSPAKDKSFTVADNSTGKSPDGVLLGFRFGGGLPPLLPAYWVVSVTGWMSSYPYVKSLKI